MPAIVAGVWAIQPNRTSTRRALSEELEAKGRRPELTVQCRIANVKDKTGNVDASCDGSDGLEVSRYVGDVGKRGVEKKNAA